MDTACDDLQAAAELTEYPDLFQHIAVNGFEGMMGLGGPKLERDVYVILAAIPWVRFFSDFDQIGKGAPLFHAAHLSEDDGVLPKVLLYLLPAQPEPEVAGI